MRGQSDHIARLLQARQHAAACRLAESVMATLLNNPLQRHVETEDYSVVHFARLRARALNGAADPLWKQGHYIEAATLYRQLREGTTVCWESSRGTSPPAASAYRAAWRLALVSSHLSGSTTQLRRDCGALLSHLGQGLSRIRRADALMTEGISSSSLVVAQLLGRYLRDQNMPCDVSRELHADPWSDDVMAGRVPELEQNRHFADLLTLEGDLGDIPVQLQNAAQETSTAAPSVGTWFVEGLRQEQERRRPRGLLHLRKGELRGTPPDELHRLSAWKGPVVAVLIALLLSALLISVVVSGGPVGDHGVREGIVPGRA